MRLPTFIHRVLRFFMHLSACVLFFLTPLWLHYAATMPDFAGFWTAVPAAVMVGLWVLTGFGGLAAWERCWRFLLPFCMFALFAFVSQRWSNFPNPSWIASLQMLAFALVIVALVTDPPPLGWVAAALGGALTVNGLISIAQVAVQGPIGLRALGEFARTPGAKLSELIAEGSHFLRPYGLTPHPNLLAGFILIALLVCVGFLLAGRHPLWLWLAFGACVIGWAALLLTFSRAAWGGFGVGGAVMLVLWRLAHVRLSQTRLVLSGAVALGISFLFLALYSPFVFARTGIGDTSYELRSFSDRALFNRYALTMIQRQPIFGVGIGANDWEAAQMIVADPLHPDLVALPVHNVPLLILSETGVIGFAFWLLSLLGALSLILRYARRNGADPLIYTMTGAFIGMLAASLLDFYMWRHFPYVVLWFGMLVVAVGRAVQPSSSVAS